MTTTRSQSATCLPKRQPVMFGCSPMARSSGSRPARSPRNAGPWFEAGTDRSAFGLHGSGEPEIDPALMMALDRGGQCDGMVLHLPTDEVETSLGALFRREMMVKPAVNVPRWLTAQTSNGRYRPDV